MPFLSVAFHTLGCKLNQLETEAIAQAFRKEGFRTVHWGERADLYLVNTCTVTSKAEQKGRRVIRKALKENPAACVIATGCYAQLDPETMAGLAETLDAAIMGTAGQMAIGRPRVVVVSGDDKSALLDLPAYIADSACSSTELPSVLASWNDRTPECTKDGADRFRFDANDFAFHSRASLKIQDGCNNACAYCRVRLARGRSVSLNAVEALARLQDLEARGYAEAVLTGINVSQYRDYSDVAGTCLDFPGLLRYLLAGTERIALRISSTEPDGVTEDFVEAVSDRRVRPHFHLSVQSLCDATLSRMRRRYNAAQVERAVSRLRAVKDDPFLACDIIAGFPGETEEEFEESYGRAARIGFAWIHAFPFSPRPGTEAATLPGHVSEHCSTERVERLLDLGRGGREAYLSRWVGRDVSAIAEVSSHADRGLFVALSENHLKLAIPVALLSAPPKPGSMVHCRIVSSARAVQENADDEGGIEDALAQLVGTGPR
jgi:threonylcarbamoyladenosine tRNA methylthiotransferase MtaB